MVILESNNEWKEILAQAVVAAIYIGIPSLFKLHNTENNVSLPKTYSIFSIKTTSGFDAILSELRERKGNKRIKGESLNDIRERGKEPVARDVIQGLFQSVKTNLRLTYFLDQGTIFLNF